MTVKPPYLPYLVAALLPFFLLITAVKLMILPWFPAFEYSRPGFPADHYGFTTAERLHYATQSINYLLNDQPVTFLSDLKLADGQPLYNPRELSHMVDVKTLVRQAYFAWMLMAALIAGYTLYLVLVNNYADLARTFQWGGYAAIGLIVLILVGVFAGFSQLFTKFHELFFTGQTWIFEYSDSLIRLFPMVFWQDTFIGVGLITLLLAGLCILVGWLYLKRH